MTPKATSGLLLCGKCRVPLHVSVNFTLKPHSVQFQCPYCSEGLQYKARLRKSAITHQIEIHSLVIKQKKLHFPPPQFRKPT